MMIVQKLLYISRALALMLVGLILAGFVGEAMVRIATADQKKYIIEMWRYATLLKRPSNDPVIGHEHIPNRSAQLQGVQIAINSLGLRGPEPDLNNPDKRKIVIIGDSLALGWGLPESESVRGHLAARLGDAAEVLNAGVGNMNMAQMVAHWLRYSKTISADTVIVMSTLRAPAIAQTGQAGWLVRNSQLYALAVSFVSAYKLGGNGSDNLLESYKREWTSGVGVESMYGALELLDKDRLHRGYKVVLVPIPEAHDFETYAYDFATEIMAQQASKYGWVFIDPLPILRSKPARSYWVSDDDIHLNGDAMGKIADILVPVL